MDRDLAVMRVMKSLIPGFAFGASIAVAFFIGILVGVMPPSEKQTVCEQKEGDQS